MRLRSSLSTLVLAFAGLIVFSNIAIAQVKAPPRPEKYHADIRYRIEADRDGRIRIFRAMEAELKALGFVPDVREDSDLDLFDPNADRMPGTIPSANADKLVDVTAVKSVLLREIDTPLPEEIAKPVRVSMRLAGGLDSTTQRMLHEQSIEQLKGLSFVPSVGYDNRGFSRIRGSLPSGQVMNLLKDLRGQPAGLFLPVTPREKLAHPLVSLNPIRQIEVLPELEAIKLPASPASASPKYSSDLRYALTDTAFTGKPMRIEASLIQPIQDLKDFRFRLKTLNPGVQVDGIVGSLVTFYVPTVKDLEFLATLPDVMSLRLPPAGESTFRKGSTGVGDVLGSTNIRDLHSRGYRGDGKTIVIIGTRFTLDTLPKNTLLLDLTAELSPTLEPSPLPNDDDATPVAKAAAAAAPGARLVLVRIEASAFHQLATIAKAVKGDLTLSVAQTARAESLLDEYGILALRKDLVTEEYTIAMGNLSDDDKPRIRREKALAELARFKTDEASFRVKYGRMETIRSGLAAVKNANAVVNTLAWDDGYPVDGLSEFAQYLDAEFQPAGSRSTLKALRQPLTPTWVQAASESTWSVWAGPAHDADGNRVLEYASTATPLPAGTWTRELNFLATLKEDGSAGVELAAGTRLKVVVQWREPHEPNAVYASDPVVAFNLQLLRQYDPSGGKTATDELALVAMSEGKPVRLMTTPSSGVYEQMLELTVPTAGRYALRTSMTAGATSAFASETRLAEVNPKITVHTVGGDGRTIFASFLTQTGGVGVGGDATGAFTVGRSNSKGQSLSMMGAGPGIGLRNKPDVLLGGDFDTATGSGISAATIGGLAACLADLNIRPAQFAGTTAITPNGAIVLPKDWILALPPGMASGFNDRYIGSAGQHKQSARR